MVTALRYEALHSSSFAEKKPRFGGCQDGQPNTALCVWFSFGQVTSQTHALIPRDRKKLFTQSDEKDHWAESSSLADYSSASVDALKLLQSCFLSAVLNTGWSRTVNLAARFVLFDSSSLFSAQIWLTVKKWCSAAKHTSIFLAKWKEVLFSSISVV